MRSPRDRIDLAELRARRTRARLAAADRRQRRRLALLAALLMLLVAVIGLWVYYWRTRKPLPAVLPPAAVVAQVFKPRYLFSIYGVTSPIGVAVTPRGDRIYVTESGGDRLGHVFDRDGKELFTFSPPGTSRANRAPVYIALDNAGNVYVTDRLQHAIYVYTADGKHVETILSPTVRLRDWARSQGGPEYAGPGLSYIYLLGHKEIQVRKPDGQFLDALAAPDFTVWAPLGITVAGDTLYVTELTMGRHRVIALDRNDAIRRLEFGVQGKDRGQFYYPNGIAVDADGRIYVADGNNSRLQIFDSQGNLLSILRAGIGGTPLGMPRGVWIDNQKRLYLVDTVDHTVQVFDLNEGVQPLFNFGENGAGDGEFNFPTDIAVDDTSRLYVTDTFNNRVQVWTY